jgi:hypothetical protein
MGAWCFLLICLVAWVTLDHTGANQVIEAVVERWDLNTVLAIGFIVISGLSVLALAFRILTWRNE